MSEVIAAFVSPSLQLLADLAVAGGQQEFNLNAPVNRAAIVEAVSLFVLAAMVISVCLSLFPYLTITHIHSTPLITNIHTF